jgi:hypothetical protein
MSQPEIEKYLQGLKADQAKRRESTANAIEKARVSDERIVSTLQVLTASDPVEYVRTAAASALRALGQAVPTAQTPPTLKEQSNRSIWLVAIVPLVILMVCLAAVVVIAILTLLGPQIANVFSKVTNGLSAP